MMSGHEKGAEFLIQQPVYLAGEHGERSKALLNTILHDLQA